MPDSLKTRPLEERKLINVHQPYELQDWAIRFCVTPGRIRAAVHIVGPAVEDVKRYLRK